MKIIFLLFMIVFSFATTDFCDCDDCIGESSRSCVICCENCVFTVEIVTKPYFFESKVIFNQYSYYDEFLIDDIEKPPSR